MHPSIFPSFRSKQLTLLTSSWLISPVVLHGSMFWCCLPCSMGARSRFFLLGVCQQGCQPSMGTWISLHKWGFADISSIEVYGVFWKSLIWAVPSLRSESGNVQWPYAFWLYDTGSLPSANIVFVSGSTFLQAFRNNNQHTPVLNSLSKSTLACFISLFPLIWIRVRFTHQKRKLLRL